jgi:hypothetical protein
VTATSSVPAVLDALLLIAKQTASAVSTDVQITDGPIRDSDVPVDQVYIGAGVVDANEDATAASGQRTAPYVGNRKVNEDYLISCGISTYRGNSQKAARDAAYALFDAFANRIDDATTVPPGWTLAGTVNRWAALQDVKFDQTLPEEGAKPYYAFLSFNVRVLNQLTVN